MDILVAGTDVGQVVREFPFDQAVAEDLVGLKSGKDAEERRVDDLVVSAHVVPDLPP